MRTVSRNTDAADFVAALRSCKTGYDVFGVLKDISERYGYGLFIVMHLPERTDLSLSDQIIITNWNPELVRAYDAKGLFITSPVITHLRKSVLPYSWNVEELNLDRTDDKAADAVQLFEKFGLLRGVYIACSDRYGQRGAVGYAGSKARIDEHAIAELNYLSLHVYERICDISDATSEMDDVLTHREKECLAWTASGKTSAEIAMILEISKNTVNHYLAAAAAKLGTVNKAHTVATAIRRGLLNI